MSSILSASNSIVNGSSLGMNSVMLGEGSNYSNSTSPLQIFVRAKKKINDIFQEIEEYVAETSVFILGLSKDGNLVNQKELDDVSGFFNKVSGIKEVLSRDHMKVAFFGRTSNGKSSVINAMLGDKILPSGIGHTTNCFLQVEGHEGTEPYLLVEGGTEKQPLSDIGQLAHALCNNKMGDSTLVRIYWPKTRCQLLRDDVVLVDSPGIDVSESLDEWIDKHCLDADVFVLVSNSESTLMNTEKNFFHNVSKKLSKPNIFILQNRWDVAASEPEYLTEVHKQHMERAVGFLSAELGVMDPSEAKERVFFVSAKEVLQQRLADSTGKPHAAFAEGFSSRYFEFQDFERKFEACISKAAVVTKFDLHTQRGKNIACELQEVLNKIQSKATTEQELKVKERHALKKRLAHTEKELDDVTALMKEKIGCMVEDVERKVSTALNEEIRRLSVLVEEFNEPFRADALVLNVYKKSLHSHVEAGLGSNLRARLSSAVALNIESSQLEMTRRMLALLAPEKREMAASLLPRREPFEVLYRLNCDNLCQDFREDINFKFSLGLVSMIKTFMGRASGIILRNTNTPDTIPHGSMTPLTPSNEMPPLGVSQDDWSLISKVALSTVGSQGTMGLALAMGVMFKTVGWKILGASILVYGGLYTYERFTWTTNAQERAFKKQYVDHATRKLSFIIDLTSHNCSHQVQQELSGIFARLCRLVDVTRGTMQRDLRQLERATQHLDETASAAKRLRNKAFYLDRELSVFNDTYLSSSH